MVLFCHNLFFEIFELNEAIMNLADLLRKQKSCLPLAALKILMWGD